MTREAGLIAHMLIGRKGMPYKSNRQRNAMLAAASGKGTLGIPKKVAKKYIKHKKRPKNAFNEY
jgi:hypothetical protein